MLRTDHPLQKSFTDHYAAWIVEFVCEKGSHEKTSVYENMILIKAGSPKEALVEAIRIGNQKEFEYQGEDGKTYQNHFAGISRLSPIHEELESGAEIAWLDLTGIDDATLSKRIAGLTFADAYATFDQVTEEFSDYPLQ